jgi:hypothetical protein
VGGAIPGPAATLEVAGATDKLGAGDAAMAATGRVRAAAMAAGTRAAGYAGHRELASHGEEGACLPRGKKGLAVHGEEGSTPSWGRRARRLRGSSGSGAQLVGDAAAGLG